MSFSAPCSEVDLTLIKECNSCGICERLLCRPVFLKCGHSPWCQQCVTVSKGVRPKNCSVCGDPVKGTPAKWPVNLALGSLLRCLFPEEYNSRPSDTELRHELNKRLAMERLDASLNANEEKGDAKAPLPVEYASKCGALLKLQFTEKTLKTDVVQWCHCDFVMLPKLSKKGQWFMGCPAFHFHSKKRKRGEEAPTDCPSYCDKFQWLSAAQRELMRGAGLLPDTHAAPRPAPHGTQSDL